MDEILRQIGIGVIGMVLGLMVGIAYEIVKNCIKNRKKTNG